MADDVAELVEPAYFVNNERAVFALINGSPYEIDLGQADFVAKLEPGHYYDEDWNDLGDDLDAIGIPDLDDYDDL